MSRLGNLRGDRLRAAHVVLALSLTSASAALAQSVTFTKLTPQTVPQARRSSGFALEERSAGDHVWMFGGFNGGDVIRALTYFDVDDDAPMGDWQATIVATGESDRERHGMAWHPPSSKLVVFGGHDKVPSGPFGESYVFLNDLQVYSPAAFAWSTPAVSGGPPELRADMQLIWVPSLNAFLLYGGMGGTAPAGSIWFSDLWKLTLSPDASSATWTQLTPSGTGPGARAAACLVLDEARGQLLLFGGTTGRAGGGPLAGYKYANDTWALDVDVNPPAWSQLTVTGTVPTVRAFTACAFHPTEDALFVYGGQGSSDSPVDGAYTFDPDARVWTRHLSTTPAGSRSDAMIAFVPDWGDLLVFGGRTISYSNETWRIAVELSPNTPPVASAITPVAANEGGAVSLDGSASSDADGDGLSYTWTQTSGPTVTLTGATTATPSFTAPRVPGATTLQFSLVVDDGTDVSAPFTVVVNVANTLNDAPVADAGPAQSKNEQTSVTLDGAGSYDVDGSALSYSWTQIAGASVTLSGASTATPSFTAPSVGVDETLTFSLVVNDGTYASAADTVDVLVVNVTNDPPVANAGSDVVADEDTDVSLSGAASSDPNGDALSWSWTQVSGVPVVLVGADGPTPSFRAPRVLEEEIIELALVVSDGSLDSAADRVLVTIGNTINEAPVANAGIDDTVDEGARYALDGTASDDPNPDDGISFAWLQIGGTAVALTGAATATPSFTAPAVVAAETLTFELTVTDTNLATATDTVVITVNAAGNSVPVAVATAAPASAGEGAEVTLDASGSYDDDGDPLTYQWQQLAGTAVALSDETAALPTFTTPAVTAAGVLRFTLVVHDGFVQSSPVTVDVNVANDVNEPPVADAGADKSVGEGAAVVVDGAASYDPNGSLLSYQWTQLSGPAVALSSPTSVTPGFTAPQVTAPAIIELALVVDDGLAASAPDVVRVTVQNNVNEPPVANAGADVTAPPSALVTLDGSASFDVNGASLSYSWTQLGGVPVVLDDESAARPAFLAPLVLAEEALTFELVVHDGIDASAPDLVVVTVSAEAGPPLILSVPRRIAVTERPWLYDADGAVDVLGAGPFGFTLVDGPSGMALDAASGAVSWTPSAEGAVPVRILVENAAGSVEQTFVVDVYAPPRITSQPNLIYRVGVRYAYDDDGRASATGSEPIFWELTADDPSTAMPNAVVHRSSGEIVWLPDTYDRTTMVLRAVNAFGADEQVFVVERPTPGLPRIVRDANPVAMAGVPYQYNADGKVHLENVDVNEYVVVVRGMPSPTELVVAHPFVHWTPAAPGAAEVTLALVGGNYVAVDEYRFIVDVVANPGEQPTAVAVVMPASGSAPLAVSLDGSESTGSLSSDVLLYAWNVGDGTPTLGGQSPAASHTYANAGGYSVRLNVVDAYGKSATDKVYVAVADGDNQPPRAAIIVDQSQGRDQLSVELGCDCDDPDGEIAAVLWEYGDGDSSHETTPRHTYVQPGSYRIRLTVWDDLGLVSTDNHLVEVLAGDRRPPTVSIYATPAEGDSPMRVAFGADVFDEDGTALEYRWLLPDGTTRADLEFEQIFSSGGYYPVVLEVTDDDGLTGHDQLTVAVRQDGVRPPRIVSEPSKVALEGIPYRYDEDGVPTAQGGRPLVWRLGKRVDGVLLNAPAGMAVDLETGRISFTPTSEHVGRQRVTLVAENVAGTWLQEFDIDVVGRGLDGGRADCACGAAGGRPAPLLALAAVVGALFARRGRRRAWVPAALALLGAGGALASPTITSAPALTAVGGEPYRYDDDGMPAASGNGPLDWRLVTAPSGMHIDNVTGELLWVPSSAGTVDVELEVRDLDGVAAQAFQVEVSDGEAPRLLFFPPEGGYVVPAGQIAPLEGESYLVPMEGTAPIVTWVTQADVINPFDLLDDDDAPACMSVTTNGIYVAIYPFPGQCDVTVYAANAFGTDSKTFAITFVAPATDDGGALVQPAISADVTTGDAALTVRFDPAGSVYPGEGWDISGRWVFGDGYVEVFDGPPAPVEHVYLFPGTYNAMLLVLAADAVGVEFGRTVGLYGQTAVEIVVTEDELRPPQATLLVEPQQGEAPLVATLTSETVQGDGVIVAYELDYGDGDRFVPLVTFPFEDPQTVHTYAAPGWYIARLTETAINIDPDAPDRFVELRGVVERDVIVTDEGRIPPHVRGSAIPARGDVPLTVTLTGDVGDLDGYVVARKWILPDGSVSLAELPSLTLDVPGEYVVSLVARDDHGLESTSHVRIEATKEGVLPPRVISLPNRSAVVGQPWAYDDDKRPTVLGGGPYAFTLGKVVDGRRVNVPVGMEVDAASGEMRWTPSAAQAGEVPVSILVENVAGVALHDFVVSVSASPGTVLADTDDGVVVPSRCACVSAAEGPLASGMASLVGLVWLFRPGRRRKR